MKLLFDYSSLLESQCKYALESYWGNRKSKSSYIIFERISKQLVKDFLPPIDREDVAAVSYSLYYVSVKAEVCNYKDDNLNQQIKFLSDITDELIKKKKTCGELIRRLIDINMNYKTENEYCMDLNSAIGEFLKTVTMLFIREYSIS